MVDNRNSWSWFGSHEYSSVTFAGKMNSGLGNNGVGLTPEFVFREGLLHYPTPMWDTGAVSPGDIKFATMGWVRESVDYSNLSVTNTTTRAHTLYPGAVTRQVVQDGDNIYVVTRGTGNGLFPNANEVAAPPLWRLALRQFPRQSCAQLPSCPDPARRANTRQHRCTVGMVGDASAIIAII